MGARERPDEASVVAGRQWAEYIARVKSGESVDLREYCASRSELGESLFGEGGAPASFLDRLLDRVGGDRAAPSDLSPKGTRYEILGELARGGMGAVLRAFDPQLRRELAMKVILDAGDGTRAKRLLPRFLLEAQVTGRLEHPGVVPVHELGIDDENRVFFTMRLVEGIDLDTVIALLHGGAPEWQLPRVLGALSRASEAVAFAHSRGVIHRDLKPANIRVGSFGETYVMDWGLAKITAGASLASDSEGTSADEPLEPLHTIAGTVVGTPAYMPPEQAAGETDTLDARADVYAMGAILYQVITGAPPYSEKSGTAEEIVERVRSAPPRPLEEAAPRAPVELVAIAQRAMMRDPDQRYPSMIEMASDLRAYLEDRVVQAHRTGAIAELRLWIRRNRATAASLALLFVVVVVGALLWSADANRRYREILRLADARRLAGAIETEATLDPPRPDRAMGYRRWLDEEAAPLLARFPEHSADLARRRESALPYSAEDRAHDLGTHPRRAELENLRSSLSLRKSQLSRCPPDHISRGALEARISDLEARTNALTLEVEGRGTWRFSDVEERWRHDRLTELVTGLEELFRPGGLAEEVAVRAEFASTLEARSRSGIGSSAAWAEAIAAIATSPHYGGLKLPAQLGLFPLGEDPESGLWEFWHLRTGDRPRPAPPGSPSRFIIGPETGVVLVLIPGGAATLGSEPLRVGIATEDTGEGLVVTGVTHGSLGGRAELRTGDVILSLDGTPIRRDADLQSAKPSLVAGEMARFEVRRGDQTITVSTIVALGVGSPGLDPYGNANEQNRSEVPLDPYFISKYELTQGQWLRVTRTRPSNYDAGYPVLGLADAVTLAHPIEQISWDDAAHWLPRMDLALPTEAQWEHAARAGTTSIWSTGDSRESLEGFANLDDQTSRRIESVQKQIPAESFDDGWAVHAPVGSFHPNPFGLHDVHGNVREHCADWYGPYQDPARAGDGLRQTKFRRYKVLRGGGWSTNALAARSAIRGSAAPEESSSSTGIRPARAVDGLER